jgi:hypothetical protein
MAKMWPIARRLSLSADTHLLDQVSEREIDFALLSALYASKAFRSFMIEQVAGWTGDHTFISARLSHWDDGRETDVLLIVELSDGAKLAIMIEDKISAIFQPDQAHGYRERGQRGIRDGRWHRFVTCLCAPDGYIQSAKCANEWDSYISFESIVDLSLGLDDRNIAFVAAICRQAVAKRAAGALPFSPEATQFWQSYRELASELLPHAPIWWLAPQVSRAQQWPRFGKLLFPSNIWIDHKSVPGTVDLQFDGMPIDVVQPKILIELPFDIKLEKTGKSAALRIKVSRIDSFQRFDRQQDEVIMALAAVERLLAIWQKIAPSF